MASRGIYVETHVRAPLDVVWARTQDPVQHVRWDVRFSRIVPEVPDDDGAARFTYERRVPLRTVRGDGISIGEQARPDGTRTSALRFATADRWSPIRSGRGYWRYVPDGAGVRFITGYDFAPGWGSLLDRVARPALGWATAWSFDRLRIWAERDEPPERWPLRSVLWFWRPERPRASRCLRAPRGGRRRDDHLLDAPTTLDALAAPHAERAP
ncbi:SRPBCC family protein [Cellulomonas composti]|uniref:Polyketide cyclase n=1 Tax=Cellulomonas composti TaxID=266130 RepID=A0A511J6C0_9CELL|nr:SRPBCC family protein [Cellulomonas composti]GEL93541.1 hypothetical protein CCO02nite_01990 [Cellulomonas composti]